LNLQKKFLQREIIKLNSVGMSVNPAKPEEVNHLSCELRFLGLIKIVESHAKQLDEVKTKIVRIFYDF